MTPASPSGEAGGTTTWNGHAAGACSAYSTHADSPAPLDGQVVVVGSVNIDVSLSLNRWPAPGQTVTSARPRYSVGGKGANQAVAAARAGGASTVFIGAVGQDPASRDIHASLQAHGVTPMLMAVPDEPSGLAVVAVADDGENSILVLPGANRALDQLDRHGSEVTAAVSRASVVLCQLETPQALIHSVRSALSEKALLILNAAPAADLDADTWAAVGLLVVNEHEAKHLAGAPLDTQDVAEEALPILLERAPWVVITLGSRGCVSATRRTSPHWHEAFTVPVVDTTAAGDTFCGVLAAGIAQDRPLQEAIRSAMAAAALTVTQRGAQQAIPSRDQVEGLAQGA